MGGEANRPTIKSPGFFGGAGASSKPEKKAVFIRVGDNPEDCFRAVAVTVVDYFLTHPQMSDDFLNKILTRHFSYFTQQQTMPPALVTAVESMQYLIDHEPLNELIQTLACTFQRIVAEEFSLNPVRYPAVFDPYSRPLFPLEMRDPGVRLDEKNSLAALSRALGMAVSGKISEREKPIYLPFDYPATEGHANIPTVVLELVGHHISVQVTSSLSARFAAALAKPMQTIQPADGQRGLNRSLGEIQAEIKEGYDRFIKIYMDTRHRLFAMINDGEVSSGELLDVYIRGVNNKVKRPDCEYGSQQFFDAVLRSRPLADNMPVAEKVEGGQLTINLVNVLAQEVSTGKRDIDGLFNELEAVHDHPKGMGMG